MRGVPFLFLPLCLDGVGSPRCVVAGCNGERLHRGDCMSVGTDGLLRRLNRRENIATIISKIHRRAGAYLVTSTPKNRGFREFPYLSELVYLKILPFRLVVVLAVGAKSFQDVPIFGVGEIYNNYVGGLVWGITITTEVIENGISDVRVSSESL